MLIDYIVANPTGNITVLVTSAVAAADRQAVVQRMFCDVPDCEQVGFVTPESPGHIRLEMMGGEFCGNATISAAAYQASLDGLAADSETKILVDSSGVPAPVEVVIKCERLGAGGSSASRYVGTLEMPMPTMSYYDYSCGDGSVIKLPVVHLEGISHMMMPAAMISDAAMESAIRAIAAEFDSLAFGILKYSESAGAMNIRPLVYVKGSDTLVWENGCASGSIAAAYYNYCATTQDSSFSDSPGSKPAADNEFNISISQPGGVITVEITGGRLYLTGGVEF